MATAVTIKGLSKNKTGVVGKTLFDFLEIQEDSTQNYTKEKEEKKTEENEDDGTSAWQRINSASKKIINGILEDMMETSLDYLCMNMDMNTREAKEQVRAIIRGHLSVRLNKEAVVLAAQLKVQNALLEYVNEQVGIISRAQTMQNVYGVANNIIKYNNNIVREYNKIVSDKQIAQIIAGKLDDAIAGRNFDKIMDRFSSSINNTFLGKMGFIRVDLARDFKPLMKMIDKEIANSLTKNLKPFIQKEIEKFKNVITIVNNVTTAIEAAKNWVRNKIEQAEAAAISWATEQTARLVSGIVKSIKISF